jgi:hypothetical protein
MLCLGLPNLLYYAMSPLIREDYGLPVSNPPCLSVYSAPHLSSMIGTRMQNLDAAFFVRRRKKRKYDWWLTQRRPHVTSFGRQGGAY